MSAHRLFAASAAHRYLACPGSMTFPENLADTDGGIYAAEGTAAHMVASAALTATERTRAADYIGMDIDVGKRTFNVTDEFAMHVQVYVDYVRDRAAKGHLLIEQSVDLSQRMGADAGGTMDAGIALPGEIDVIDLKFGMGERVFAAQAYAIEPIGEFSFHMAGEVLPWIVPNYQLMMYALGGVDLLAMFGPFTHVNLHIVQPRLDHIDVVRVPLHILEAFGKYAGERIRNASDMLAGEAPPAFNPGTKQCRWCRAKDKDKCPALDAKVQAEIGAEFDTLAAVDVSPSRADNAALVAKYSVLSLIEDWVRAVRSELESRVLKGIEIIGVDGKPMKVVLGDEGPRKWRDEKLAEAALLGQLPVDKVYAPQKIITAPVAAKLLLKKKTERLWADFFAPLITRAQGKPVIALGSDPRPVYNAAASADEFEIVGEAHGTTE